ncbi:MAG TPA: hypothetical protein VGI67_08695 [Thermoleophilaceae bacterium]|jgi:hypothetical protein
MPARLVLGLALAGALLCCAVPASARTTIKPTVYKLALPTPGHVSVAAVEVTVQKHGRGTPPSRLSLTLPNRFAMPDSVRFFYARRRIAISPLRYELLLVAVNRVTGSASTSARASKVDYDAGSVILHFPSRASGGHTCASCGKGLPLATRCSKCWFKKTGTHQVQVVGADTGSPTDLGSLDALLRAGWTNNGDTNTVFGNPATGAPPDRSVDGGYFDDHRAFGWNAQSLRDPGPLLHTVVDDLLTSQPQKIVPDLELIGQTDLNGNGVLDSAATPGGGSAPS